MLHVRVRKFDTFPYFFTKGTFFFQIGILIVVSSMGLYGQLYLPDVFFENLCDRVRTGLKR